MSGRLLDMVDEHPAWVDITGSNWWYQPHVGSRLRPDGQRPHVLGVSVDEQLRDVVLDRPRRSWPIGWSRTWWRLGVEFNLANSWQATDSNWSTWVTRFNEAAAAIKAAQPGARIVLCPNEGNGAGLISSANTVNLVDGLQLGRARTRLLRPVAADLTTSRRAIRDSAPPDVRHDELLGGRRPRQGKKIRFRRVGVASGTQWAGNQGGDNPLYIDYPMSWLYANRDVVEVISYFEEPAAHLVSDITTPASQPDRAGHVSVQDCPVRGELTWWPRPASSSPARRGSL